MWTSVASIECSYSPEEAFLLQRCDMQLRRSSAINKAYTKAYTLVPYKSAKPSEQFLDNKLANKLKWS